MKELARSVALKIRHLAMIAWDIEELNPNLTQMLGPSTFV